MELVQALGYKVTLLPANLAWMGSYTEDLQRDGVEVIHSPFVLSRRQFLEERGAEFDVIYITRYTIAAETLPLIQEHAPQAKLLFCNADLHYLRELRAARAQGLEGDAALHAREAVQAVKQLELQVMQQVDLTLSYSEVERAVIEADSLGDVAVAPCPWVVEPCQAVAPLQQRSGLAFLGSYGHPPNRDALDHFLNQQWPAIAAQAPQLRFHIYGSGLTKELAQQWSQHPGVVVEGWIAQASTLYQRHRLFIAPLRSGAGIKGKVIAAAAHGLPQVLSPLAAEATGLRHRQEVWIARTDADWIEAITTLCENDQLWQHFSAASLAYARSHYSREQGLQLMREAFERLQLPVEAST